MTVKEHWLDDIEHAFFDTDEFADTHTVNGEKMPCVIDNFEMIDRERKYKPYKFDHSDGIYTKQILMFVRASDFGPLPAIGRRITVDKKNYIVTDAINEGGAYSLTLELNKA